MKIIKFLIGVFIVTTLMVACQKKKDDDNDSNPNKVNSAEVLFEFQDYFMGTWEHSDSSKNSFIKIGDGTSGNFEMITTIVFETGDLYGDLSCDVILSGDLHRVDEHNNKDTYNYDVFVQIQLIESYRSSGGCTSQINNIKNLDLIPFAIRLYVRDENDLYIHAISAPSFLKKSFPTGTYIYRSY